MGSQSKLTGLIIFLVSCNHFMQRPLRDMMASLYGAENMNWLMTGTLAGSVLLSLVIHRLEKKACMIQSIPHILVLMAAVQIMLYFSFQNPTPHLALIYFGYTGTTSLTLLSLVFRRLIHSNGGIKNLITASSLGALSGPLITWGTANLFRPPLLLLLSCLILTGVAVVLRCITEDQSSHSPDIHSNSQTFPLKRMTLFTLLYTFIATGFYYFLIKTTSITMNQGDCLMVFSLIDIIVNGLVVVIPVLFNYASLSTVAFIILPCTSLLLYASLGILPTLMMAAVAIILFKLTHLTILKPVREMLFTSSLITPYSTKNFMDTTIYRLGDALGGWFIALLISFEIDMQQMALYFLPAAVLWILTGYSISKKTKFIP